MLVLGLGIPVDITERGIASECAIGPFRVLSNEEVGEPRLGGRVVDALVTAAGDPNISGKPILACRKGLTALPNVWSTNWRLSPGFFYAEPPRTPPPPNDRSECDPDQGCSDVPLARGSASC